MKYVIKSKDRINTLTSHTYKLLKSYEVCDTDLYIFVSNEDDLENYCDAFPNANIKIGEEGIVGIDNFIVDYFNEKEEYIYMNDDISSISILNINNKLEKLDTSGFKYLVKKMFSEMKAIDASYCGLYPCDSSLYMSKQSEQTEDLCLIIDGFSACINNKNIKLTKFSIGDNWLSDYEKSILHFKDKGIICRLNKWCFKGKFFNGIPERNQENHKTNAMEMMEKYPGYISSVKSKKNGWNSLRFKKISQKKF